MELTRKEALDAALASAKEFIEIGTKAKADVDAHDDALVNFDPEAENAVEPKFVSRSYAATIRRSRDLSDNLLDLRKAK